MHYMVGEVVEGVVTGIKPYGAFVYLDSKHNGLIHISEISELLCARRTTRMSRSMNG